MKILLDVVERRPRMRDLAEVTRSNVLSRPEFR